MIGITGVATSGKDTLFNLINRFFSERKILTKRYALADFLKKDLEKFIYEKFNINISDISSSDKELIRPLMVAYGKIKRNQTNGRYWIENLNSTIKEDAQDGILPVITDIRYNEYEMDELFWLKKENKGFLVHVSRVFNGKIILPANKEESDNDQRLLSAADYSITWCTESNIDSLYNQYQKNLKEIYESYRRYSFNK
jgi:hypothetical protein